MGSDLYIRSIYNKNQKKYEPSFYRWVKKRDALDDKGDKDGAEKAQKKVHFYHELMYSEGYFRDSYNNSSLFQMMGLSWWVDMKSFIIDGQMSPEHARELKKLIAVRQTYFIENLKDKAQEFSAKSVGESEKDIKEYFIKKYFAFNTFLDCAIALNEPIDCSI
jgi:hypothetical protein